MEFFYKWCRQKKKLIQELASKAEAYETSQPLRHLTKIKSELSGPGFRVLRALRWTQPSKVFHKAPLISVGNANSTLPYGFIKIYKTSLIFADVDLQLSPSVIDNSLSNVEINITDNDFSTNLNDSSANSFQQPHYFISEKRRLKFKEIHYFDHPKFGVILGVWPGSS